MEPSEVFHMNSLKEMQIYWQKHTGDSLPPTPEREELERTQCMLAHPPPCTLCCKDQRADLIPQITTLLPLQEPCSSSVRNFHSLLLQNFVRSWNETKQFVHLCEQVQLVQTLYVCSSIAQEIIGSVVLCRIPEYNGFDTVIENEAMLQATVVCTEGKMGEPTTVDLMDINFEVTIQDDCATGKDNEQLETVVEILHCNTHKIDTTSVQEADNSVTQMNVSIQQGHNHRKEYDKEIQSVGEKLSTIIAATSESKIIQTLFFNRWFEKCDTLFHFFCATENPSIDAKEEEHKLPSSHILELLARQAFQFVPSKQEKLITPQKASPSIMDIMAKTKQHSLYRVMETVTAASEKRSVELDASMSSSTVPEKAEEKKGVKRKRSFKAPSKLEPKIRNKQLDPQKQDVCFYCPSFPPFNTYQQIALSLRAKVELLDEDLKEFKLAQEYDHFLRFGLVTMW